MPLIPRMHSCQLLAQLEDLTADEQAKTERLNNLERECRELEDCVSETKEKSRRMTELGTSFYFDQFITG